MTPRARYLAAVLAVAVPCAPALADECVTAMLATAQKTVSVQITKTDAQGKRSQSRTVQARDALYVQTQDGQWHVIQLSIKDKVDTANEQMKTAKLTCRRIGSDRVGAVAATIYTLHVENDGVSSDSRVWVSGNSLVLRSDTSVDGVQYSSLYDYDHVAPPANATAIGAR